MESDNTFPRCDRLRHVKAQGQALCMIKIFMGAGVVDGEGDSSERCMKWGFWGFIKGSFQDILKQGVVKAKDVSRGKGVLKVSSPQPPLENFNRTLFGAKISSKHLIPYLRLIT